MKKIISVLLALVMCMGLCAVAWAMDPSVAKVGENKYTDLREALEAAVDGGTVELLNDVTLTGEWTPVGTKDAPFKGGFDGGNYVISGLKVSSGDYIGLFGYVGEGAVIENVKLAGATISGGKRVGALIGQIKGNATVKNCSVDSTSTVTGSDSNTGGLIGEAAGTIQVTLQNLTNNASVENTEQAVSRAAGIIAQITSGADVTIINCVNNGTITTNNGYVGGIAAAKQGASNVTFESCANTGTLTGAYTGNLLAWVVDGHRVSMTNSGDAAAAIGAVNAKDYYTFYFNIDGEEYYIRKAKSTETPDKKFSELWNAKKTIDAKYMDRIIAFFDYAKTVNQHFVEDNYPATRAALFDYSGPGKTEKTLFNNDLASGWPQLLTGYNDAKQDDMTADDFKVTWFEDILYSVPDPQQPDPTPDPVNPNPDPVNPDPTPVKPERPDHPIRRYPAATTTTEATTDGTDVTSAKTFDGGVMLYAGMALTSAVGMAWMGKKRGR